MYGDPTNPRRVDPAYENEYRAAIDVGAVHLTDGKNIFIPSASSPTPIIYHGWMFTPEQYTNLYDILASQGYQLINNPAQYVGCHYFNNWYPVISDLTPNSIIVERTSVRAMLDAIWTFQTQIKSALVIKDSVKSLKHHWHEACFIPRNASNFDVAKLLSTFLYLKDKYEDFQGSLIVRQYIPLKQIGVLKSGMPISQEIRAFILKGKLFCVYPYWNDTIYKYQQTDIPFKLIEEIAGRIYKDIKSELFTIDLGMLENGSWECIEVGDGQVSALPDNTDIELFFKGLAMSMMQ